MTIPKPQPPPTLRYRARPAWIGISYVIVLMVSWILTCVLSSRTVRQSWVNSGAVGRETAGHLHRVSFLIDALNFITAVVALPVIYALLARAAVVFSQRTDSHKALSVKQLFALADRNFVRYGLFGRFGSRPFLVFLGAALVLLAVVLPPVRAILVHSEAKLFPEVYSIRKANNEYQLNGWAGKQVGQDPLIRNVGTVPRDLVIEKTRLGLINAFPTEWTAEAWYDPDADKNWSEEYAGRYFASSLARDTTTGMYRQHALRMNSSSMCERIPTSEVPVPCPGLYDDFLDTSYDNANLTVNICVPEVPRGRFGRWNETENRQDLTETLYISVSTPVYYRSYPLYANYTLRCIGKTSMGYFELGNSFNGEKFGPLLSSFKFPTTKKDRRGDFSDDIRNSVFPKLFLDPFPRGERSPLGDYGTLTGVDGLEAHGPLAFAAHAMFGAGSFFELAQYIREPNDTLSRTLCQLSPIPFSRTELRLSRCDPQDQDTEPGSRSSPGRGKFASTYGWANDRVEALISGIRESNGTVDGMLNTAMYLANKATLEAAVGLASVPRGGKWDPRQIWRADGIQIRTPVVSTAGLVVVTVLLGLQVVGILALLRYIYSVPTWTETLDAMALARITGQLAEGNAGFLVADTLRKPTPEEVRQMGDMDGLVGLVEHEHLAKPTDNNTLLPKASGEATLTADTSPVGGLVLGVGAPGLISRRRNMKTANNKSQV